MTQLSDPIAARLGALENPLDDSDWREVRARARTPRRVLLGVVVAALAVLLATPALGLHEPIVRFFSEDRAPKRVQVEFATLDEGAPEGMAPGVIAKESRRVTSVSLSDGRHTLFVAPTRDGGFCLLWTKLWGGCDRYGTVPLSPTMGGEPYTISGHVDAEWVSAVEVRFADGSRVRPKVTWVSEPIGAGFFAYEVEDGRRPESVAALDDKDDIVTEQWIAPGRRPLAAPQPEALVDRKRLAGEISVAGEPARVWIAPSNTEGRCAWVEYGGDAVGAFRCLPKRYPSQGIAFGEQSLGGRRFVLGQVMPKVQSIDVNLASGRSNRIQPFEDVLLIPVPVGQTVESLVFRNSAGDVIVRIPLRADSD